MILWGLCCQASDLQTFVFVEDKTEAGAFNLKLPSTGQCLDMCVCETYVPHRSASCSTLLGCFAHMGSFSWNVCGLHMVDSLTMQRTVHLLSCTLAQQLVRTISVSLWTRTWAFLKLRKQARRPDCPLLSPPVAAQRIRIREDECVGVWLSWGQGEAPNYDQVVFCKCNIILPHAGCCCNSISTRRSLQRLHCCTVALPTS